MPKIRIPPQNIDAEQSLLGALLIDKDAILKIEDRTRAEDFYKPAHAEIFSAVRDLQNKREPIDMLTLTNRLNERGKLEEIGGRAYLVQLASAVATSAHVQNYAEIIQKKATLRRLLSIASEITELAHDEKDEIDNILDIAEQKMFSVSTNHLKANFTPITEVLDDAFDRIDELHRDRGKLRGIPTGFPEIDQLLAGLQKSDLVILAARPSVGKTSFALDIARMAAVTHKVPVGIFSLEMSKEQLVDRMICSEAGVDLWRMRTGKLDDRSEHNDFTRIGHALGTLSEAPIYIDDTANINVMQIRTKARRLQSEKGLGLIVIDYLQLMESRSGSKKADNRVQEVAEISRALKGIARELDIPVLALSQLSRLTEQSKPAIPKLSHLRDSGAIEQDADVVMFIYRKSADKNYIRDEIPLDERYIAEIHIAKHRNGPTGIIKLTFNEEHVNFESPKKNQYASAGTLVPETQSQPQPEPQF